MVVPIGAQLYIQAAVASGSSTQPWEASDESGLTLPKALAGRQVAS